MEPVRINAVRGVEVSTGMGCKAVVVYDSQPSSSACWTTRCGLHSACSAFGAGAELVRTLLAKAVCQCELNFLEHQ